jgi:hypothetical protein
MICISRINVKWIRVLGQVKNELIWHPLSHCKNVLEPISAWMDGTLSQLVLGDYLVQ